MHSVSLTWHKKATTLQRSSNHSYNRLCVKPFIEQGLAQNSRGDSYLDVSEISKKIGSSWHLFLCSNQTTSIFVPASGVHPWPGFDEDGFCLHHTSILEKQVQNRFMSGSKRNKRGLKLRHVRQTPSNQTFPINFYFLGEGVYHSPAEILSLMKKTRRYSIGFAAATLAAAITSPAFLNCKKSLREMPVPWVR